MGLGVRVEGLGCRAEAVKFHLDSAADMAVDQNSPPPFLKII